VPGSAEKHQSDSEAHYSVDAGCRFHGDDSIIKLHTFMIAFADNVSKIYGRMERFEQMCIYSKPQSPLALLIGI
jgi:hypothetical protein